MDDTGFVGTVLNLTGFRVFHGGSDVRSNSANFRVRHHAAWAQDLTQGTNDTHGIWRSDNDIERHVAGFDLLSQVFHTNDVGASCFGSFRFFARREDCHAYGFAGTSWQHDGAAHHLVGFLRIYAQLYRYVDRFIELGRCALFDQSDSVVESVHFGTVDFGFQSLDTFG